MNRATLSLLRKGAGLEGAEARPDVVGDSLDHLIGSWSERDETELLKAVSAFERVDPSFWDVPHAPKHRTKTEGANENPPRH